MQRFHFRVDGVTKRDIRRWRQLSQPSAISGSVLLSSAVAVALIHGANQTFPRVITKIPEQQAVVQTVPPAGSSSVPVCMPSIFFLDQRYGGRIDYSLNATYADGRMVDLTGESRLIVLESQKKNPIVILVPERPYPKSATISGRIRHQNPLGDKYFVSTIRFSTGEGKAPGSIEDLDLEAGTRGFVGQGDFGFVTERGGVKPRHGEMMAGLSTGRVFGGGALEGTTTMLSIGPIETASRLSIGPFNGRQDNLRVEFDYNFISSEFDKYVGTKYDDTFLVVLYGPSGAEARLIASINQIGAEASTPVVFPGLPKPQELPPQESGWRPYSVSAAVGSPACVTFVLTDVGDARFESVVTIDAFRIR